MKKKVVLKEDRCRIFEHFAIWRIKELGQIQLHYLTLGRFIFEIIHFKRSFKAFPQRYSTHASSDAFMTHETNSSVQLQFQYIGIDGNKTALDQQKPTISQLCCLMCFPCCVGPFCSVITNFLANNNSHRL